MQHAVVIADMMFFKHFNKESSPWKPECFVLKASSMKMKGILTSANFSGIVSVRGLDEGRVR